MKTNLINTIIGSAIAVTIAAALAFSAQAADQIKGAQCLLQPSQTAVAADTAPATRMACAKCQSVWTEGVDIQKGHIKVPTYSETHLCSTCKTTLSVVGEGKARKQVVNHTCAAGDSCCAMNKGS
jgi:hypothetical protein